MVAKIAAFSLGAALLCSGHAPAQQRLHARTAPALESPARIAADAQGRLLVTDHRQNVVATVDPLTRRVLRAFAVDGKPGAIGWFGGRIFVGNETRKEIQIFTPKGQLLGVLGGAGTVVGRPSDLAVDPASELLFVVDTEAKHVKVFDLSVPGGQLLQPIGAPGSSSLDFQNPTGIAVDPVAQEVYVADYGDLQGKDPRILIFGYDGGYHAQISGDSGTSPFYFSRPQGLAIGQTGHVFITDAWAGEVVVMDRATGLPVAVLGSYGSDPGELKLPLDLVISGPNHDVFVTNNRPKRLEYFAQGGLL